MTGSTPVSGGIAPALVLQRVALVALLAVLLGFAMQAFILGVLLTDGISRETVAMEIVGGVTWSVLVCTGINIGIALAKGRAHLSGFFSFCVAPLALALAKGGQKMMAGWLGAAESQAVLSLGTVGTLRAVEYGLLGWLLGRLAAKDTPHAWRYLGSGAAAGVVFGGAISFLTWQAAGAAGAPLAPPKLAATVVNEVAFPIGCALVIFLGQSIGRHLRMADGAGN